MKTLNPGLLFFLKCLPLTVTVSVFFLQILILYDSLHIVDVNKIVEYIQSLQQEDGSFAGDKWGKF